MQIFAIHVCVEKECTRCKNKFIASTAAQDVCSKCVGEEFAQAGVSSSSVVAETVGEHRRIQRRQIARAARMRRLLDRDAPFSLMGKVRCALAVVLFLVCLFFFMVGDSDMLKNPVKQLEIQYQLLISVGLCLFASCCLLTSFRDHKFIISMSVIVMMSMGVAMPFIWQKDVPENQGGVQAGEIRQSEPEQQDGAAMEGSEPVPVLTNDDLAPFRRIHEEHPGQLHYAVYMDNQTTSTRSLVRESLTRLLQAEYTRAFTCHNGALFVVVNARSQHANMVELLSRFGRIVSSNPEAGVYEVNFSADKANIVSRYSQEVQSSPQNPNFVPANISELMCLDTMRVRAAAQMLTNVDAQVLRTDIHRAILQVLRDPWESEEETYKAIVEALVTYAPRGHEESVQLMRAYFDSCRANGRPLSQKVVERLISENPASMVDPVVQMWSANPVAWGQIIGRLGSHAEDKLLADVSVDSELQRLDSTLKYLADYGTEKAIPFVESLLNHSDSLISHKAERTLRAIRNRYPDN